MPSCAQPDAIKQRIAGNSRLILSAVDGPSKLTTYGDLSRSPPPPYNDCGRFLLRKFSITFNCLSNGRATLIFCVDIIAVVLTTTCYFLRTVMIAGEVGINQSGSTMLARLVVAGLFPPHPRFLNKPQVLLL